MSSGDVLHATGQVTGKVANGLFGEVMLRVRGGSEAYLAFPADPADVIEVGEKVFVTDFLPPRSVRVARY